MLGLFGLMKENLEQQGVILPRFFKNKNELYYNGSLWTSDVLDSHTHADNGGTMPLNYRIFAPNFTSFDFSKESWSLEVKITRTSYYSGSNRSYVTLQVGSSSCYVTSALDKKTIHVWWGPSYSSTNDYSPIKDFAKVAPCWLKTSYDKNTEKLYSYYSYNGSTWNLMKEVSISSWNMDLSKLQFMIGHCAKDATIYRKDIKFIYGDEVLFG